MPGNLTTTQNAWDKPEEKTELTPAQRAAQNKQQGIGSTGRGEITPAEPIFPKPTDDGSTGPVEVAKTSDDPTEENYREQVDRTTPIDALPTLTLGDMTETKSNIKGLSGKALKMREILLAEEKVGFVIPLDPFEKPGSMESIIMNGYQLLIEKGKFVRIPISVAKLLADSHNVTMDALNNHPTNMNNPESQLSPGMQKSWGGLS